MAKQPQISNAKPRVDKTRGIRAKRRQAFMDAAAKRMGMLDWGSFQKWIRECMEDPDTDEAVNDRLRRCLWTVAGNIKIGDPNIPPADVLKIFETYPNGGKNIKMIDDYEDAKLSPKTLERIQKGIEKMKNEEAGRLATRPKPPIEPAK